MLHTQVIRAVILVVSVICFGTIGYNLLERWPLIDSLYMTIITMTTVGFGEIYPLSDYGRVFTIVLILMSVGIVGYLFSTLTAFIVSGEVRKIFRGRRMDKEIEKLTDHIILCGMGRIGLHIAEEFLKTHTPFVVIEQDEAALEALSHENILYLKEDATEDETLLAAGIKQAKGLVTTLNDDKENVFVVLCARSLNPNLKIIARLVDEKNEQHLRKAGADRIVSPDAIGGSRMASIMLRPTVITFLDEIMRVTGELRVEEMNVDDFPVLRDRSLGEINIRKLTGALVMAINSQQRGYQFNPGADTFLRSGDVIIVVGTEEQVDPKRWEIECAA